MRGAPPRTIARLLVRASARSVLRSGRTTAPRPPAPAAARFDVYTFVTDAAQYADLRASFAAAGFGPPLARFVELRDRSHPGGTDPFELITRLGREQRDAYAILVHQDVRLDRGAGRTELAAALDGLTAADPDWTIAGNAGGTADLRLVRYLHDPYGGGSGDALPAQVVSLDENLLVFNPASTPRCSPQLHGFHFYGTDACLNAIADGGSCYVVDFPVTHLGAGRIDGDYEEARRRFVETSQDRFRLAFLLTPTGVVLLARSRLVRRLLGSPRVAWWVSNAARG